ncbi:type II toxin-antitoxin system VapC family toxin [Streptosporangiaceae bacterium NEAU-GS5]|nr:type II toxin-antitoxin system VapC family toxin [Streptosporangiaceae bacterium NEAU-GS5]
MDAGAVVQALVGEDADEIIDELSAVDWMSAPFLLDYEVHNVLRKMVFRCDIGADVAQEALDVYRELRISRHAVTSDMSCRIWTLRSNFSAYDASYVVLAETLDVPMVTTDKRLADAVRKHTGVGITDFGPAA